MGEIARDRRALLTVLALAAGAFAFNTLELMPVGLLNLIADDLGISIRHAGALTTAYAVAIGLGTIPLVALAQRAPRRGLIVGLLVAMTVSTAVFVALPLLVSVHAARITTALAHGVMWSVMGPTAVAQYPPHLRGRVLAVVSAGGALAAVAGLPGGVWLGDRLGWQAPFVLVAVLGGCLAPALWILLKGTGSEQQPARAEAGNRPDLASFVASLAIVGMAVFSVFVTLNYVSVLPVDGLDGDTLALALLVFGLSGVATVPLFGRLLDWRCGPALAAALALLGVAFLFLLGATRTAGLFVPGMALLGAAAMAVPLACQYVLFESATCRVELALAINSVVYNGGVALGAATGGILLARTSGHQLVPVSLAIAAACVVPALAVVSRRPTPARSVTPGWS
jgi:predicted MFS family arabinose efflux permease